jgi:CHASE1-domain containing sensor protein
VLINNVQGTIISTPGIAINHQVPATDDDCYYAIQLVAPINDDENGTNTNII